MGRRGSSRSLELVSHRPTRFQLALVSSSTGRASILGVCAHAPQRRSERGRYADDTRRKRGSVSTERVWYWPGKEIQWPASRQSGRPDIELTSEAPRREFVPFTMPPLGDLSFIRGQRVDLDREPGHQRAASRRRTSAQGMVLTAPLSSSAMRRFTSAAQAASASSSTSVSRLSRRDPASAARASAGNAKASFKISAASRFIGRL